jgi:hypothetical protein
MRIRWCGLVLLVLLSAAPAAVQGQIQGMSGTTGVQVAQYATTQPVSGGTPTGTAFDSDSFPDLTSTLPLQVVARLFNTPGAAAAAAAQLADPNSVAGPNPEEFAFDLALESLAPGVSFEANAATEEVREIVYPAGSLGNLAAGEVAELRGKLFIDGALAAFAVLDANDLTGVVMKFKVTITKDVPDQEPVVVFYGGLTVTGGPQRDLQIAADGAFPTDAVIAVDLDQIDPELGVFRAYVFPNAQIEYAYTAVIGQSFKLRARIETAASNRGGGSGLLAVLGTPVDSIQEVIAAVRGEAASKRMVDALKAQRASPTGRPAFATAAPFTFSACGLFGFEAVVGVLGVASWGAVRRARWARKS